MPKDLHPDDLKRLESELTKYAEEGASDDELRQFRDSFTSELKKKGLSGGGYVPKVPLSPNGGETGVDSFGTENAIEAANTEKTAISETHALPYANAKSIPEFEGRSKDSLDLYNLNRKHVLGSHPELGKNPSTLPFTDEQLTSDAPTVKAWVKNDLAKRLKFQDFLVSETDKQKKLLSAIDSDPNYFDNPENLARFEHLNARKLSKDKLPEAVQKLRDDLAFNVADIEHKNEHNKILQTAIDKNIIPVGLYNDHDVAFKKPAGVIKDAPNITDTEQKGEPKLKLPGAEINTNKTDKTAADVIDQTKIDYSKARNRGYADSISEIVANAVARGNAHGEEANLLTVTGDQSSDDIKRLANIERRKQFYPTSESYAAFNNAKTFSDALGALASDPVKIIAELSLESLTALARHGSARIGAGTATGATTGSVVPGIGTASGAATGAIVGLGLSSLNLEYSGSILESLGENGIDVSDPESLKRGFEDEEKFAEIRKTALQKGVPVALFDMLSAGLAGRVASKPAKTLIKKAAQIGAEAGVQAGLGGAGEVAGELTAGQKINPAAILGEMVGELGGGAPEIITGTMFHKAKEGTLESGDVIKAVVANPGNPGKIIDQIDVSENSGELPEDVSKALKVAVTKVAEIDSKVPPEIVEPEKRQQSIELIMTRNGIDDAIKVKTEELQNVDEAFRPIREKEIATLTKERDNVNKEILGLSEVTKNEAKPKTVKVEPVPEEGAKEADIHNEPATPDAGNKSPEVQETGTVQDGIEEKVSDLKEKLKGQDAPQKVIDAINDDVELSKQFEFDKEGIKEAIVTAGTYDNVEKKIRISPLWKLLYPKSANKHVLLHEAVHAATMPVMWDIDTHPEKYTEEQIKANKELLDTSIEYLKNTSEGAKKIIPTVYGTTNVHEFVAEFISNPDFKEWVSKNNPTTKTNIGNFIWKNILETLGIKKSQIDNEFIKNIEKNLDTVLGAAKELNKKDSETKTPVSETKKSDSENKVANDKSLFLKSKITQPVFHATTKDFDKFEGDKNVSELWGDHDLKKKGFYFTADKNYGETIKGQSEKGKLLSVALDIRNPKYISKNDMSTHDKRVQYSNDVSDLSEERIKEYKKEGYDGIVYDNGYEIVAFDPEQIEIIKEPVNSQEKGEDKNGKTKDEQALETEAALLNDESPTGGENLTGTLEKEPPAVEKSKDPEKKKRRLTQQILKDKTLRDEFKASIGEDEIFYDVLPNDITLSEANTVIDYLGVDNAIKEVENDRNGMKMAVRNTVSQILIKQLEKEGDYDRAIDLREKLVKSATEQGQGIQAFAMFPTLSPEGEVRKAQRMIIEDRAKKEKQNKRTITKLKDGLRKVNKEAAKEAVDKVSPVMEEMGKITVKEPKKPKEYGKSNKIVTQDAYLAAKKAMRGKFFAVAIPPELITIGAYHIEAGSRKFADFANAMVEEFGNKVKPYIKGIYDKSKEEIGGEGYSTDEEVQEYENKRVGGEMEENVDKVVKGGLKDFKINLADIVVQHYTVYDATKQTLAQKLIDKAGLSGEEATRLSNAIQVEFDRIATLKKKQLLEKAFTKRERAKPQIKTLEGELIKLTNLGAFNDNDLVKAYGDKMGWPKLTETQVKTIESLATKVQEAPEGFKKVRLVEDLLAYQANIPGVSKTDIALSIWYANILSGLNTQVVNFVGNVANTTALFANAVAQNPKSAPFIASGFVDAFKRGVLEAQSTLQTGYSPIRGKVEVPATLERVDFKKLELWGKDLNPANYLKYVRRVMVASDVILFEVQKDMRAYQLAWKQAVNEGKMEPTTSMKDRALQILNQTDEVVAWAETTAEGEYDEEVVAINEKHISSAEKSFQIKNAEQDRKRRVYELIEEQRGSNMLEDSKSFAARGTYNYTPEGALGVLANVLNQATEKVPPLKLVIPFTNIIANVANEAINYTPLGFARTVRDGSITGNKKEPLTEQEKIDLTTKAIIGTSLMAVALILSQPFGDDDEPFIQITANGTGDYRKNYELAETGWQPYSIKVGAKWVSYQYTPLMLGLGFIGQIRDFEKYRNGKIDDNFLTKVSAAAGYTMKSLFDMTFLSSLNTTLSAAMDNRNEDRLSDLGKQAKTTAKGFVLPSLYTQSAREVESFFDIPTKEVRETFLGDLLKDIPVARNMYNDKINGLGEPVIADTDKIISARGEHSKAWDLIAQKRAFVGTPSLKQVTVWQNGVKRFLTPEEYFYFCKDRGTFIKDDLEKNYDKLMKAKPEAVQDYMKGLKRDATKQAKNKIGTHSKK